MGAFVRCEEEKVVIGRWGADGGQFVRGRLMGMLNRVKDWASVKHIKCHYVGLFMRFGVVGFTV